MTLAGDHEPNPPATCAMCGTAADAAQGNPPLGWTLEAGAGGRAGWVCPACTREHVRAIEGKLDLDWW